jgi:hypothetical protein
LGETKEDIERELEKDSQIIYKKKIIEKIVITLPTLDTVFQ